MAFACINELEIAGGSGADRGAVAALVLAVDCVNDAEATRTEASRSAPGTAESIPSLVLRFESVDGLPEDDLTALAPQFPSQSFTLAYFSLDGEFYGYCRAGPGGSESESEDFTADTRELVGRRHDGDAIAFVRSRFGLAPKP